MTTPTEPAPPPVEPPAPPPVAQPAPPPAAPAALSGATYALIALIATVASFFGALAGGGTALLIADHDKPSHTRCVMPPPAYSEGAEGGYQGKCQGRGYGQPEPGWRQGYPPQQPGTEAPGQPATPDGTLKDQLSELLEQLGEPANRG